MSPTLAQATDDLLKRCIVWLERFVVLSPQQKTVIAAWVLHTWAIGAFDFTAYLYITAPEKGCGKTRLLEALRPITYRPWLTGRVSAGALVRKIAKDKPTLLLDEGDAAFKGDVTYAEALRGILNSGYARSGYSSLCVGKGTEMSTHDFSCFGPKAIAGIGMALPETVLSRSIVIAMQRKTKAEKVERFRERDAEAEAKELKARLEAWATPETIETLRSARPPLPDQLTDRQWDISEPLIAIADLAGGTWPEEVRAALVALFDSTASEDNSIGVQLLKDIRGVFDEQGCDALSSFHLTDALCRIEGQPWAGWMNGKGLNPFGLARQLKKHGIAPRMIRFDASATQRGYTRDCFKDAWERYCPSHPVKAVTPVTGVTTRVNTGDLQHGDNRNVTDASRYMEGFAARRAELPPSRFSRPVAAASRNVSSTDRAENPRQSGIVSAVTDVTANTDSPALSPESFNPFL